MQRTPPIRASATMPGDDTDRRGPTDRHVVRLHEMTAVILCGGMGTRLREET